MKVGDLVWVNFKELEDDLGENGTGIIVESGGFGFYTVFHDNEQRTIHSDFLEKMNEA